MLAMVGGGGRSVDLAGVERGLLGPVVVDVNAVQCEPVLTGGLVKRVGHLKSVRGDNSVAHKASHM